MDFMEMYAQKKMTAEQAASLVKSGDWVDYGWCVNTPVAVDAALAKAAALNRDDYLDLTAVDTAVNAVIRGKKIDEQSVVDAMAKAIEDALAALQTKPTPTPAPTEAPQATAAPTAAPTATAAPTTIPTAAPAATAAPAVQAASAIPATGDDVNLALLWALLVISGGAAAVLYSKRKRE